MVALLLIILIIELGVVGWWVGHKIEQSMEYAQFTHEAVVDKLSAIDGEVKKRGHVTDPFKAANKRQTPGASTKHIIVRKTPDQIRNENYEKIKEEGQSYGWAD